MSYGGVCLDLACPFLLFLSFVLGVLRGCCPLFFSFVLVVCSAVWVGGVGAVSGLLCLFVCLAWCLFFM